jgi:hypothetical protein
LRGKVTAMEPKWAADNLQVIRTLMERSALYRRALAPIMIVAGGIGVVAAIVPCISCIHDSATFVLYWMGIGGLAIMAAFLLVRRQALKESEPFWSPPTRRISQAMLPPFSVGAFAGLLFVLPNFSIDKIWMLPPIWMMAYGCGLHAAGFFTQRGIRLFGFGFVGLGAAALTLMLMRPNLQTAEAGHYVMGIFFGLLHLAFGTYLYFTEKRKNAA